MEPKPSIEIESSSPSNVVLAPENVQPQIDNLRTDIRNFGTIAGISNPGFECDEASLKCNSSGAMHMIKTEPERRVREDKKNCENILTLKKVGKKLVDRVGEASSDVQALLPPKVQPSDAGSGADEKESAEQSSSYVSSSSVITPETKMVSDTTGLSQSDASTVTPLDTNLSSSEGGAPLQSSEDSDEAVDDDIANLNLETSEIVQALEEAEKVKPFSDKHNQENRERDQKRKLELRKSWDVNLKKLEEIRDSTDNVH